MAFDFKMNIEFSVVNKQLLSFSYDGYFRVVEPHTLGLDKKGHPALSAYQIRGGSESGEHSGWKLFHINEMHNLSTLPEKFLAPRPGYKRGDSRLSNILAQL